MSKKMAFFLVLLVVQAFMVGCASKNKDMVADEVLRSYEAQKPIQVRTSLSDNRPAWVHKSFFEEEGSLYFSGGYLNGADYPLTVRCANAEALKVVVQSISQFIRSEFSSYIHGEDQAGRGLERYVSDGIATFTSSLHVQGLSQKDLYYEEQFSPLVMQPSFNVWVQLVVSKADYMKAKADMLRRLSGDFSKARETEAKRKAEDLLEGLKNEAAAI